MSKSTIIAESGEGTMHDLRKIAVAEPWGIERNLARQNEYSFIWKSEPYMLDACLGNKVFFFFRAADRS